MRYPEFFLVAVSAVAITGGQAQSQEVTDSSPFSIEMLFELQSDVIVDSDVPGGEFANVFGTVEAAVAYAFTDRFSANASLTLEQITAPTNDSFLEDHGLYAEELYLSYDFGGAEVIAGKFNPFFGEAWDTAPGIYGADFAEDYQITERLGATLMVPLNGLSGEHQLSFAVFRADRSVLSESLGENRGRLKQAAGGVSNTGGFSSAVLSISGQTGATSYNVAVQNQDAGRGDAADQNGVVLGLSQEVMAGTVPLNLLGEVAWFDDFDGARNSASFVTLGVEALVGPVSVSAVYARRDIDNSFTDNLATLSGAVELAEGFTAALAYRYGDEGGDETHTIGTLLAYEF